MAGSLGHGLIGGPILVFSWSDWEKSWLISVICGGPSDCNPEVKLEQTCVDTDLLEKLQSIS